MSLNSKMLNNSECSEKKPERPIRIAFVVAISFMISVSILYFVNDWYLENNEIEIWRLEWYNNLSDSKQKNVYLLGNSRTYVLNETNILNSINNKEANIAVYDLSIGQTRPAYWSSHIEKIISSSPELVIFGIDPRDFARGKLPSEFPIPKPNLLFKELISNMEFSQFKNPKLTTLKNIQYLETGKTDFKRTESQPFFSANRFYKITPINEMIVLEKFSFNIKTENFHEKAIIEFINVLKENNIKTVLVVTPRPQMFVDNFQGESKEQWKKLLQRIEENTGGVKIYNLQNKFSNQEIFADINHVTRLPPGQVFDKEIAEIILLEHNS